jgi:hypothetical protein
VLKSGADVFWLRLRLAMGDKSDQVGLGQFHVSWRNPEQKLFIGYL